MSLLIENIGLFTKVVNRIATTSKEMFKLIILFSVSIFVAGPLVLTYLYMMVIKPWIDGGGEWEYVHSVWATWQTFNAAMIAFLASLIAIYAAKHHEEQRRSRELLAARAQLPQAISGFATYCEELITFYKETLDYWSIDDIARKTHSKPKPPLFESDNTIHIFSNCMTLENKTNVVFIADILSMNQYISARASSEYKDLSLVRRTTWKTTINNHASEVVEMHVKLMRLFPYGRDLDEELNTSLPTLHEMGNSCLVLDLERQNLRQACVDIAKRYGDGNYDPNGGWY